MENKVKYLKDVFDKFLKDNNVYDAWYERYRLDNLIYEDDIPIEEFIEDRIKDGENSVHGMFYIGIGDTVWHTQEIDDFIEKNKQCDILTNSDMADMDAKWMDSWHDLVDLTKLF